MEFLLSAYQAQGELFNHTWKNNQSKYPAFLDDYSYLISALIELAQITGKNDYLDKAKNLTQTVVDNFSDEQFLFFYFTHKNQNDVLIRKKEIYDGATPSGNSIMAYNLYRLSIIYNIPEWRTRSEKMVRSLSDVMIKYPTSFGVWLGLLFEMTEGTKEIAILGKNWEIYLEKLLGVYISHKLAQASAIPLPGYPLLADKPEISETRIYLCENYACRQPVSTLQEFVSLLHSK